MSLRLCMWVLIFCLVGCQQADPVLPTLVNLDDQATEAAATAFAIASPTRTPLPPTWTPSPPPSPTEPPVTVSSPTPENFRPQGTLYYIFNGDSIVELSGDGSFEDLLPIPHLGQSITDLAAAPDGSQLAYIAPGSGSAREIYLTDRTGTTTTQLSRLGFARVENLVWRPDSSAIAFLASQAPELPLEIYLVGRDGTGQRRPIQRPSPNLRDLTWNGDGSLLFFSDSAVFALNPATGLLSPPLTAPTGFGPDIGLAHSPLRPRLYYLKTQRDLATGETGGVLSSIDTTTVIAEAQELRATQSIFYTELRFVGSDYLLLVTADNSVSVQQQTFNSSLQLLTSRPIPPHPVLSPDAEQVAYVDLDEAGVPQIFIISRQGGEPTQITRHSDGAISNLVWLAG